MASTVAVFISSQHTQLVPATLELLWVLREHFFSKYLVEYFHYAHPQLFSSNFSLLWAPLGHIGRPLSAQGTPFQTEMHILGEFDDSS